jgi:ParB family chromosome partitioning protein
VTIAHGGALQVERGLVRPEDAQTRRAEGSADPRATTKSSGGLSATLIEDLTAHRTMALRVMMTENTSIALATLAHALALPLFYGSQFKVESCLDMRIISRNLRSSAGGVSESKAATAMATHEEAWRNGLPGDEADLFGWLCKQDADTITRLLAYCAAQSVDAVRGKFDRADCPRLKHGDDVATALDLDMKQWWKATKGTYFGRVSKASILEAVTEGVASYAARDLAKLKKDALADSAEERLGATDWLPAVLRRSTPDVVAPEEGVGAAA